MLTNAAIKKIHLPHTNLRLLKYLEKQPVPKVTLKDIQKSLSKIGLSLSKRIVEDRDKR